MAGPRQSFRMLFSSVKSFLQGHCMKRKETLPLSAMNLFPGILIGRVKGIFSDDGGWNRGPAPPSS